MGDVDPEPSGADRPAPCARCGSRGSSDWVNGWNDAETVTREIDSDHRAAPRLSAVPTALAGEIGTCSTPGRCRKKVRADARTRSSSRTRAPSARSSATFLTGLRDGRILGIRAGDGQGALPADRVGSRDRRDARPRLRRGRPGRRRRDLGWVTEPTPQAPARPPVRVRAHQARRRRHRDGARGRRAGHRRDADGHARHRRAGRTSASVTSPTSSFVPGGRLTDADAARSGRPERAGRGHGLLHAPRVPRSCCARSCAATPPGSMEGKLIGHKSPKCGLVYAPPRGYGPIERDRDDRRRRGRARRPRRRSPTSPSSRRCSTTARRRPSRFARRRSCSTAGRHARPPGHPRHPGRRRAGRAARRGGVGRPRASATSTRSATAGGAPTGAIRAGDRPASPTSRPRSSCDDGSTDGRTQLTSRSSGRADAVVARTPSSPSRSS